MFLELEEMPWRKFQCSRCGREFPSMGRNPRCPDCGSLDIIEI